MPVTTTHPSFDSAKKKWTLTDDAVNGLDESNGKIYIRKRTSEAQSQYDARVERAIYTNYTGRTLEGLAGAVFRKDPKIDLPPQMLDLVENFDSSGASIVQVARGLLDGVLRSGHVGTLIDFPTVEGTPTKAEVKAMNLLPYAATYKAGSIINYKTGFINGKHMLTLLVLAESASSPIDEFDHSEKKSFRVLRLEDGIYTQQQYNEEGEPIEPPRIPVDYYGKAFDHIPFYFAGSKTNSPDFDLPVMLGIARINIGHYRNSADHEANLAVHGCGTLIVSTSMSKEEFDTKNPNGLVVGENNGILLEQGDSVNLLQLDPAQAISSEMERKEDRMQQIGAKIIMKSTGDTTAEEARIDSASEHSVLDTVVGNVSECLTLGAMDMARFMGVDPDPKKILIVLNNDFWFSKLDPQVAMALVQLKDVGALPLEFIIKYCQASEIIPNDLTVDEIIEMVNSALPI